MILFMSKNIDRQELKKYAEDKGIYDHEDIQKIGDNTIPIGINDRRFQSYKNSIVWLKTLPKDGPRMLAKAGE